MKELVYQCQLCFPWRELPHARVILTFVGVLMCSLGIISARSAVAPSCQGPRFLPVFHISQPWGVILFHVVQCGGSHSIPISVSRREGKEKDGARPLPLGTAQKLHTPFLQTRHWSEFRFMSSPSSAIRSGSQSFFPQEVMCQTNIWGSFTVEERKNGYLGTTGSIFP